MLREYIISEAMYGLKIPTTRSLAVVKTGEKVIRGNFIAWCNINSSSFKSYKSRNFSIHCCKIK
jgi:uncharacterized protein YdiU (UPF0061 family)